ncbi:universal stress protein [Haloferax namakaokahaiae]|uniref:Universal stress protein n=1 Tax=Haloferax namakaokahaiae TaxID=1748331 RepID=A0ABD5ZEW8_9EURY
MTRKVLVPIDGGPLGVEAVEHAMETFPDSELTLLYVIDPRYTTADDDELHPDRLFTQLVNLVEERRIPVRTETRVGHPGREIVEYCDENDVDEIVIGSHGRDHDARILLGSVAKRVTRRAPVPVTIVRPKQRHGSVRYLVALDHSEQSQRALEYALASFPDAELTVLHVVESRRRHHESADEAARLVDDARKKAREHGVEVRAVSEERDGTKPARAILDYVTANDIDHVIVGSHGRSGASRILLGSVAESVARRSPVPVTVVR